MNVTDNYEKINKSNGRKIPGEKKPHHTIMIENITHAPEINTKSNYAITRNQFVILVTLGGHKVSTMLTLHTHTNTWGRLKVASAITKLTAHF